MFKPFAQTALSAAVLLSAGLSSAQATSSGHVTATQSVVITVSCFRGPWEEVIWDRPNAVFIDSLVEIGYTFPEAHAIGERVCRDASTVDRPDNATSVMLRIIAENPPGR